MCAQKCTKITVIYFPRNIEQVSLEMFLILSFLVHYVFLQERRKSTVKIQSNDFPSVSKK